MSDRQVNGDAPAELAPSEVADLAARVGLEPLITVDEFATLARVSRRTAERWIADGRLKAEHLSPRAVRIRLGVAAAFLGVEPVSGTFARPDKRPQEVQP